MTVAQKVFKWFGMLFIVCISLLGTPVWADDGSKDIFPSDVYYQAKVIGIIGTHDEERIVASEIVQQVKVILTSGKEQGREVVAQNNIPSNRQSQQRLSISDKVVVVESYGVSGRGYYVVDVYRAESLLILFFLFIVIVLLFGRMRGLTSLIGLAFSIIVLVFYLVPRIASGHDPLVTSITGAVIIMIVSLYCAHGVSRRTSVALLSSFITLIISSLIALVFIEVSHLFGTGTEDALYLQIGLDQAINVKGLLLGGMIIGMLGVLDDITIGQAAAIDELRKANSQLTSQELYGRGLAIGREHIASLVNTLALAYAGVALPLFLLFSMNASGQPFWVVLNNESVAEEIIRSLVGSIALIVAVPLSTFLAAHLLTGKFFTKHS